MNIEQPQTLPLTENQKISVSSGSILKQFSSAHWVNHLNKKSPQVNSYAKNRIKNFDHPTKRWGHSSTVYNKQMVVFGGRQSTKNLANIYSFDFESCLWQKIDPLGQIPPARDSHSTILVSFNMKFVFGMLDVLCLNVVSHSDLFSRVFLTKIFFLLFLKKF